MARFGGAIVPRDAALWHARHVSIVRLASFLLRAPASHALCLVLTAIVASGCGARTSPPAPVGAAFPSFEFPAVTPTLEQAPPPVLQKHQDAWNLLQSGQPRAAAKAYADIVSRVPAFYPAKAGLGYSELAEGDYKAAVSAFDATLALAPAYLPALAGRAEALVAADRPVEAIAALEALLATDPSRSAARTRLETLRLGTIDALVEEGRQARQRGDLERARAAWTRALQASPDSAFMYRELAAVERQGGQLDAAREHAQAALRLDDRDAPTHALLGEVEAARGDVAAAVAAYRRAQEIDARADYRPRIAELERALAIAALPEAYRAIAVSPQLTRGDMAALLGVAFEPWLAAGGAAGAPLITDARSHWAQRWILGVAGAGLMEVYANHTFQPGAVMRRIDLADVVRRTLEAGEMRSPSLAAPWRGASATFTDLPASHAAYGAAALAVGAGIMQPDPGQTFAPRRPVTGAEASAVVERLASLLLRR
jgi:tetratricopeptide (TPR) repeat protein